MKDSIKAGELGKTKTMVKIREVRVGNFLENEIDGIDEVIGVRHDGLIFFNRPNELLNPQKVQPIPLSNEVLEKVKGCELISESTYKDIWDIEFVGVRHISLINYKVDKSWEVTFGNCAVLRDPHLHILQNVVYFNWGKELEITL